MVRFGQCGETGTLSSAAIEEARALVPGVDCYAQEEEWRAFLASSRRVAVRSNRAFLGSFVDEKVSNCFTFLD